MAFYFLSWLTKSNQCGMGVVVSSLKGICSCDKVLVGMKKKIRGLSMVNEIEDTSYIGI